MCDAMCAFEPVGVCESVVPDGVLAFVVPYMAAPSPTSALVSARTAVAVADLYFLFDITGSMDAVIAEIESSVVGLITGLECAARGTTCAIDDDCGGTDICYASECIESPAEDGCLPSVYTGTGTYETSYANELSLQPDPSVTATELGTYMTFGGVENLYDAIRGVADPASVVGETGCTGPSGGFVGCPSFRPQSRRILFVFTNEDSDAGSASAAGSALAAASITLIGIDTDDGTIGGIARPDLEAVAIESGSFRADGTTPLVYDAPPGTVTDAVTAGLDEVLTGVPQEITISAVDLPADDGDALQFIDHIATNTTASGCGAFPSEDRSGDGIDDTYPAVPPGGDACFDIVPAMNTTVMSGPAPLVFRALVTIYGDGAPVEQREVYFVVPI